MWSSNAASKDIFIANIPEFQIHNDYFWCNRFYFSWYRTLYSRYVLFCFFWFDFYIYTFLFKSIIANYHRKFHWCNFISIYRKELGKIAKLKFLFFISNLFSQIFFDYYYRIAVQFHKRNRAHRIDFIIH